MKGNSVKELSEQISVFYERLFQSFTMYFF